MSRFPYILTVNIRRSVFEQYGIEHYRHLQTTRLSDGRILHLLPVVNNLNDGIEIRAQHLAQLIPKVLSSIKAQKAHLLSYSASGIDSRYALSHLSLNKYCSSLTTLATPHLGSKVASLAEKKIFSDQMIEPIARMVGLGMRPFWEISNENLKHFNRQTSDASDVKYFSIGAQRLPNNMNEWLKHTGNYLRKQTERNFVYENDGVVGHDESQWGEHLVNFEADHAEIIGITPYAQLEAVFNLVADNISLHFEGEETAKNEK